MTKANKVKKPFYKRVWFWVLAVIVLIAVLPSAEEEPTSTVSEPKQAVSDEKDTKDTKADVKTAGIGDTLKVGDVSFTVHGKEVTDKVGDAYVSNNAQGVYMLLDVSVKNEGKEPLTVDASFFTIKASDTEYSSDASADVYINDADTMFFLTEINPGNELRGKVAFDVNEGVISDKSAVLNVQTGFWGTEQGEISIAD